MRLKESTKKYLLVFGCVAVLWTVFTVFDKYSLPKNKQQSPKSTEKIVKELTFTSPGLRELNELVQKPAPVTTLQVEGKNDYKSLQYSNFSNSGTPSAVDTRFAAPTIHPISTIKGKNKPKKQKKLKPLPKVEVFVSTQCQTCRRLEDFLRSKRLKFKLFNIDKVKDFKKFKAYRYKKIPMVRIGKENVPGNSPELLLGVLNKYKW